MIELAHAYSWLAGLASRRETSPELLRWCRTTRLESAVSKFREKAQGRTKQTVGQMIGDEELVREGKEQEQQADREEKPRDSPARSRDRIQMRLPR